MDLIVISDLRQQIANNEKVEVHYADAFNFLETVTNLYDVIFIDLPDPNSIDLNKLYTREFYYLCSKNLAQDGSLITQSGSPYYATKAFFCVNKTLQASGFYTFPMHNQVLTLGEWGWIIGRKRPVSKEEILQVDLSGLELNRLNQDALHQITNFGKPLVDTSGIQVNTIISPVLYQYYKKGNWNLF